MVSPNDLDLLHATDDPEEAVELVVDCYERRCAEIPTASFKFFVMMSRPPRSTLRA